MRAVHDKIEGPFAIEENIALYGMVAGDATLHRGIRFILHGTITGNLTIETGARAIIHGTVAGRIYNEGGRVEIFGIADAVANGSRDAITIIDPAAHVPGRPCPRSAVSPTCTPQMITRMTIPCPAPRPG